MKKKRGEKEKKPPPFLSLSPSAGQPTFQRRKGGEKGRRKRGKKGGEVEHPFLIR